MIYDKVENMSLYFDKLHGFEKIEKAYLEISKKWSVEAKKEPLEYFYNVDEMAQLQNGEKTFVIGRKGSGKTSIVNRKCNYNIFCFFKF